MGIVASNNGVTIHPARRRWLAMRPTRTGPIVKHAKNA